MCKNICLNSIIFHEYLFIVSVIFVLSYSVSIASYAFFSTITRSTITRTTIVSITQSVRVIKILFCVIERVERILILQLISVVE